MNKLKKTSFLPLLALVLLYLASRLFKLTALPLYNDEAMYINWGRLIVEDPQKQVFISLTDGQQPLFLWLVAFSYWLGKSHFLFFGRMISVIAGLGTLITLYFLGKKLFSHRIGFISASFYVLAAFPLWYDRLAIKDSFLMLLAALIFYFAIRQVEDKNWWAIIAGLILGIALLTKGIAYFFIGLYPLTVFLLTLKRSKKLWSDLLFNQLKWTSIALLLAFVIQSLMFLSPLSSQIGPKNSVFLLSLAEVLNFPIQLWRNNLYSTIMWWWQYYGGIIISLAGLGFGLFYFQRQIAKGMILLSWIILPIIFEIFTAKIYIPRYFLFTFIPLSLVVAYSLNWLLAKLKNKYFQAILVVLVFLPNLILDSQILFEPAKARLPQVERWQYFEGWPAGYGFRDLVIFLKTNYLNKNVLLITEKETLVSSGLPLYLTDFSNIKIKRVFDLEKPLEEFPLQLAKEAEETLIIIHHYQSLPKDWPVEEIIRIPRFNQERFFLVYKLREN